jgi:hypothetical protein
LVSCRFVRQSISMIAWEFVAKSNPCENFLVAEDFHENTFFQFGDIFCHKSDLTASHLAKIQYGSYS